MKVGDWFVNETPTTSIETFFAFNIFVNNIND